MRTVMISLDKSILDMNSRTATRLIAYGEKQPLFIIVPSRLKQTVVLSANVTAYGSGGRNKLAQFWNMYGVAEQIMKKELVTSITAQDPFFTGLLGVWLKQQFRLPLEVQLHGDFYGSDYYKKHGWKSRLMHSLGKYILCRADKIRVVGERVKRSVISLNIPEEKIIVRPVPVPAEAIAAYQPKLDLREKYPGYDKIFLALGRLDPVKNLGWLLETFAGIVRQKPNCFLLIVGDGKESGRLEQKVRALGLGSSVRFEPFTADPWSYIRTADCLLFPSLSEGYGLVVMEAVASGTPVVMTDVGVANYEVQAGPKVTIVPVNDKEKFIQAMLLI